MTMPIHTALSTIPPISSTKSAAPAASMAMPNPTTAQPKPAKTGPPPAATAASSPKTPNASPNCGPITRPQPCASPKNGASRTSADIKPGSNAKPKKPSCAANNTNDDAHLPTTIGAVTSASLPNQSHSTYAPIASTSIKAPHPAMPKPGDAAPSILPASPSAPIPNTPCIAQSSPHESARPLPPPRQYLRRCLARGSPLRQMGRQMRPPPPQLLLLSHLRPPPCRLSQGLHR